MAVSAASGLRRRVRSALLVMACGLWLAPALAEDRSLEYPIKAAYLYKLGDFVEWPPGTFADAAAPVVICIIGADPFGRLLDQTVQGQRSGGRAIVVQRFATVDHNPGCQIAYAAGSDKEPVPAITKALAGAPVLVITDGAPDGNGGVINFVVQNNRVRFEADQQQAEAHGLRLSAKLLNLAVAVRKGG